MNNANKMINQAKAVILFSLIFSLALSACNQNKTASPISIASPTFPQVNTVATKTPASTPKAKESTATVAAARTMAARNSFDAVYLIPENPEELEYILRPEHIVRQQAQDEWNVSVTSTSSWDEAQQILEAGIAKALIVHHAAVPALNQTAVNKLYTSSCIILTGIGTTYKNARWERPEELSPYQFFVYSRGNESTNSALYEGWSLLHLIDLKARNRNPDDFCRTVPRQNEILSRKPEVDQTIVDMPINADQSGCERPGDLADSRISFSDDCIFWLDERDDELGFEVYLTYPNENREFVFRVQPNQTQLKVPAEAQINPDDSFEQCTLRNNPMISAYVKTAKTSTTGRIGSRAINIECNINQEPSTEPSLADGLVINGIIPKFPLVIRNGEAVRLTDIQYKDLIAEKSGHNDVILDDAWAFFSVNGNIYVLSSDRESLFYGNDQHKIQTVWGIVGEWLIVSLVEADRLDQQAMHELAAVALDGSGMQIIAEDIGGSPAIAPDGSQVIFRQYNSEQAALSYAWTSDSGKTTLSYEPFSRANYSPNGRYIALSYEDKLIIRDADSNEILVNTPINIMGTHGLLESLWNSSSTALASTIHIPQNDAQIPPVGIHIQFLNGSFWIIEYAISPNFSPDGTKIAVHQLPSNVDPATTIFEVATGEQIELPFEIPSSPVGWIQLDD